GDLCPRQRPARYVGDYASSGGGDPAVTPCPYRGQLPEAPTGRAQAEPALPPAAPPAADARGPFTVTGERFYDRVRPRTPAQRRALDRASPHECGRSPDDIGKPY